MTSVVISAAIVVALLLWVILPRRRIEQEWGEAETPEAPDHDALEAAERDVRDLDVNQRPDEGFEGDDWGPGAGRGPR